MKSKGFYLFLAQCARGYDAYLYLLAAVFCFFSFNHPDILHTIACSTAILNGHIRDFYEVTSAAFGHVNYLPATYLVFAAWGIPLKLLGFFRTVAFPEPAWLFFWYKALMAAFFAGSAAVLYKICLEFTKDRAAALLGCAVWLASPVAFFSQFIFGQYDVLSVFFMLLGLLYYVRGDLLRFSFWFAVSVSFKYFPAFIFFPLLALREKNFKRLLLYSAVFGSVNLLQIALCAGSPAFVKGVLGFGAAKRALNKGLLLWPLISVYAYFVNYRTRDPLDLHFYARLCLFSFALIFSHTPWHPQWLLVLTPFIAVLLAYSSNSRALLAIDAAFSLAFFSHTFRAFPAAVDTNLFGMGLWGLLDPAFGAAKDLVRLSSVGLYALGSQKNLFHVIIGGLLLLVFLPRRSPAGAAPATPAYGYIRARFYGVIGIFLLSAFYAYHVSLAGVPR